MSRQAVDSAILEPMQRLYVSPRSMDESQARAALADYAEALEGFDEVDLQSAWRDVRDSHTSRSWPPIATFVNAAKAARRARAPAKEAEPAKRGHRGYDCWAEFWRDWDRIRRSDIAREAAAAGVAWSLKCEVLDGTPLSEISVDRLVRAQESAERTYTAIRNGKPLFGLATNRELPPMSLADADVAMKMYEANLVREAETAAEIAGL